MDKHFRKKVITEIGNLLDSKCRSCEITGCELCPVQAQLLILGQQLAPKKEKFVIDEEKPSGPKVMKVYVRAKPQDFVKLFDAGKTNIEVKKILNVTDRTVVTHRQKWKKAKGITKAMEVTDRKKRIDVKHNQFVTYFEKDLTDREISNKLGVVVQVVWRHRKQWKDEKNV